MTGTCLYIVIESQGGWWVDCEGKAYGPFRSQDVAGRGAIEIARTYGDMNRPREVLSKGEHGLYNVLWSSEFIAHRQKNGR